MLECQLFARKPVMILHHSEQILQNMQRIPDRRELAIDYDPESRKFEEG